MWGRRWWDWEGDPLRSHFRKSQLRGAESPDSGDDLKSEEERSNPRTTKEAG